MRYIAAYMLATLGGNANPSSADVAKILKAGGISVDQEEAERLVSELSGKDLNKLMAEGSNKMASIPAGGAGPAVTVSSGSAPSATATAGSAAGAGKKEEKVEEEEGDMGFGLFD